MSIAIDLEKEPYSGRSEPSAGLLAELLREQQLTAVEKFSQRHRDDVHHSQSRFYRDLIPVSPPNPGEHYSFEVDLDACSGCKACVVACHNLNGLEEQETWRSVGLLHGGAVQLPVLQHVTAACHHCLAPACLDGCPVEAYEKDPITGIVRHLDDQCIGCQYCILKCPYDAPKYSRAKGIVRKCDMCSQRLAAGEAPACVQACPTRAIRITVIDRREAAENAEANLFLPGAPEPGYTLPTTVYKTRRALPANLLPADYYSAAPQHAHWPLVLMLLFTQMSVGAFLVDQVLHGFGQRTAATPQTRRIELAAALGLGVIGLAASIFHLGRPWLAYRAIIGWRRSWLSREVLAFSGFAVAAWTYAVIPWAESLGFAVADRWERALGAVVVCSGLAGVICSTMIYASTRRAFWNPAYTGIKFLLSCLVLGIPTALLIRLAAAAFSSSLGASPLAGFGPELCWALVAAASAKLLAEAAIFRWLGDHTFTPLRRTALLMTGDLGRVSAARFLMGVAGGVAAPALIGLNAFAVDVSSILVAAAATALLLLNFTGELLERYLFFAAVVAPKMPGAPAA